MDTTTKHTPKLLAGCRHILDRLATNPMHDDELGDFLRAIIARDETETNTAPDLLAALQQCLPIIDAYRRASGGDGDIAAMVARHAIARATGNA